METKTSLTFLQQKNVLERFSEILGESKAMKFRQSLLTIVNNNKLLQSASPNSIYSAAMMAASMDLSFAFGHCYVVPYKGEGQFQLGYKGYTQLALRTGLYRRINAIQIYEGQLKSWNPLYEEIEFDFQKRSNKVIGYAAHFSLGNFEKTIFTSIEEIHQHRDRYSQTYRNNPNTSPWKNNPDEMGCKTVLKKILNRYGILSVEMERAIVTDQAVIKLPDPEEKPDLENPEIIYVDNDSDSHSEVEAAKIVLDKSHPSYEKSFEKPLENLKSIFHITPEYEAEWRQRNAKQS